MKKQTVRISLKFVRQKKADFTNTLALVIVCLENNLALVPNLPFTIAALDALQAAYLAATNAAAVGGSQAQAELKSVTADAITALRQIAAYIQSLNLTEAQVLSLGFQVVVWQNTKITLVAPLITGLDNSYTTQLGVYLQAVYGAKSYHVQYCTGTGAWVDAGIWPNTKDIIITDLTPGTVYGVRVRGIGGSMQYGPWSATVSLMCT